MRSINAIILVMLAVALSVAVPFASEEGDADITVLGSGNVVITGDIVLEEDVRIESGAEVLVSNGASIDISNHNLAIGQGAKIVIVGSASITSSGGSIILEGGEPIEFGTVALPAFEGDVRITFDGTISLELKILSGTLSIAFEPSGSDKGVHVERGGTELTLVEPSIVFKLGLGTVDVIVGFSEMTLFTEKYDGNTLLSTNTTTITSSNKNDSLDLALCLKSGEHGHLYLKDINIVSVETSTYYEESGITSSTKLSGFDRLDTSLEDDGILTVSSHIDTIVTERYLLDVLQSKDTFEDIDWVIAVDLPVLFQVLYAEMTDGTKPDASELIETIDITVETGTLENHVRDTVKNLSDISIVLSLASSQHILEIQWQDDDASYRIISSNLVLNSFGLSSSFMMDLDVSVPLIKAEIKPFGGPASDIVVTDMELGISNMDLPGLYIIYSRLGTMDVQQLLDNCERFHLSASSITYAKSGHEMVVRGLDAVLEEDARRMNTLGLSVDSVEGSMVLSNGGILEADVEATSVCFSTDGSLAEYLEIMNSVPEITTNSEMTLKVNTDGANIDYAGLDRSLAVSSKGISFGASGMNLDLSIRHTLYKDSTLLNGSVSASGYELTLKEHDYGKKMYLDVVLTDAEVSIDDLDVGRLAEIYHSDGKIGATEIADNTDRIAVQVGSAVADYGDDHVELESMDLRIESSGRYMATISSGTMAADIPVEGSVVDLEADSADLLLSSDVSFTELQKVSVNGFEFESDASIDFTAKLAGLNVKYAGEGPSMAVSGNGTVEAKLSFDDSVRWNRSVLSASLSAEGCEVSAKGTDKDGKAFDVTVVDPEVDADDVDVSALLSLKDAGTLGPVDILDNTREIVLIAAYVDADYDDSEFLFESLNVRTSSLSSHTLAVDYDVMSAHVPSDNGFLDARSGTSAVDFVSDISFNEIMDALKNGLEFDSDVDMSLEAKLTGLEVAYAGGSSDINVTYETQSGAASPTIVVTASLSHSVGEAETMANLSLDAIGYGITAKVDDIGNGTSLDMALGDPHLSLIGADIAEILSAYDRDGTVSISMLDHCKSIEAAANYLSVKMDEGEKLTMVMTNPELDVGADKKSTVHVDSSTIDVAAPVQDGELKLEATCLVADISSTTTFSELFEIINNRLGFDSDAEISMETTMSDAAITYAGETMSFSLTETDDAGSSDLSLNASLVHTEESSETLLGIFTSTAGYTLEFDSHGLHYGKVPVEGDDLHVMSVNPGLTVGDLQIVEILDIYDKTKSLKPQEFLDLCGSFVLSTAHAEVEWDGDEEMDASVDKASAGLSRNSSGNATVAFEMEEAKVAVPIHEMIVDLHANETEVTLSSDISFSELTELIFDGMEFTEDTDMAITLSSKGLDLGLDKDGSTYRLSLVPREESLSNPFKLDLDLNYILYNDKSSLSGKLDTSGYTTTVVADMDEEISKKVLSLPFSTDVGTSLKFVMEDLASDMSGFDIKTVYDIIAETKTISVQQLIDSSNSLGMSVASISADIDSDDAYDATLSNVRASLNKSILGQNTTSFGFEELATTIELEKGTVDVHSGASEAVIITEGSITECIDAFLYGVNFSTETRAEIHLSNESLLVEYRNGENYLSIANEKMFSASPQYVTMVLSMEYSDYKDTTSLSGRLSSIGHSIVLYDKSVVNDDGGIVYLTLETDEVSGGFEVDYAEDVSLSANLFMPWKIDFSYYDVEFKIESSDSITSLTHGTLDVDGYDQKEEGLLAILPAIKDSDFTYDTRVLLSSGDMSVYGNDGTTVLSSYGNTEIGIKKALVDLKRGDVLNVSLEKLDLSITDQDGKVTEKSLDRLDVTKDVSGAVPEEGWVEKNSLLLAIVFLAAAAVMVGYMVRYHMKRSKGSEPEDSEPKE